MTHLGRDLLVAPFHQADDWGTLDLTPNPPGPVTPDTPVDLAVAGGVDCLRQALLLRLLTPLGSLRDLGHARYGSRLHELIGTPNTEQNRLRARAFVLQAVARERRVQEVLDLQVLPPTLASSDRILIHLQVRPVGGADPIALGLEVNL